MRRLGSVFVHYNISTVGLHALWVVVTAEKCVEGLLEWKKEWSPLLAIIGSYISAQISHICNYFSSLLFCLCIISLSPTKHKPSHGRNFWAFLLFNFWSAALSPYWALSEWMWKEREEEWFRNSVEELAVSQFKKVFFWHWRNELGNTS